MVGDEVHICFNQATHALVFHTDDTGILAAPKITVVYKQRIRTPSDGGVNHGLTCCDSAGNFRYTVPALDLQSIGGIIFEL